jgi:hypothetical protein
VKFGGVTLDTTCGPLVLRRLQAWVDDSAPHVESIISRQVMELLGFSTDDLLVGALKKRVEWDVSGEVDASRSLVWRGYNGSWWRSYFLKILCWKTMTAWSALRRKFIPRRSQAATRNWLQYSWPK